MGYAYDTVMSLYRNRDYKLTYIMHAVLVTLLFAYILDKMLQYKLFKWIYFAVVFVIVVSVYNTDSAKDAIEDAISLYR
jgi:hypothetical protein